MVFPSGLCNVFRQNGPKQGPFSQVSAFPFAPKLSSRESSAIFAQTHHRPLKAEQEFVTIWLGWDRNNSSELSLLRACFLIVILSYRFFPYHLLTITSTFELLSTLCVYLDRHVDRVVRPVSEENGILVIEVTDGLRAHQANTSLRPGLLLVGRLHWPSIINRFVMHCLSLSRRLWQGSNWGVFNYSLFSTLMCISFFWALVSILASWPLW